MSAAGNHTQTTLTRATWIGPWAGLPIAWTDADEFDEETYRAAVSACCRAGMPGVYTGGTTGEFYALEFDEFQRVARATVEECRAAGKPAMIGCTSTYTLGAARRAQLAAELGAAAVQVALPFWMEVADDQVVPFFREVARAAAGLPISVYETTRAKKTLSLEQHRQIKAAVPSYLMVKANAGTIGCTPAGCRALSEFVNVFVGEHLWGILGREGAQGSCSAAVYWNPPIVLELWDQVQRGDWDRVDATCAQLTALYEFFGSKFATRGFTDSAFDHLGATAGGFVHTGLRIRGPYPAATANDVACLREWYRDHWPQMGPGGATATCR
ncbi:MAG TPA: dihydrodipicolinate synthase family protein [Pirellulales bacterium]|jgi:dihydrodipicolinate synthase/N-acetylneuraminate lyase|nr:dihydrodipicolinate synthase family protein [Pirellulales bacterium]